MKVFADKSSKARKVGDGPMDASTPEAGGPREDRLAQGFDLLFGAQIKRQRQELELSQATIFERLEAVEAATARHSESVEDLTDRSRASLEREQGEYRRRKVMEDELRQTIGELRAFVTTAISELHDKTARIEGRLIEELDSAQNAQSSEQTERYEEVFRHLEETLAELKTSKLDRNELQGLFTSLAERFGAREA